MLRLNTILCPVDFSDATPHQVKLAADIARLSGGRLVLHHNLASLALGAGVGWMWAADQRPPLSSEEAAARLDSLAATLADGVPVEFRITEGPASKAVVTISNAIDADLIVLSTHHASSEEHTSVTSTVLDRAHRAVLALHDTDVDTHVLVLDAAAGTRQVAVVPTDLTPESATAVAFAFELARTLPLQLHLVHFIRPGTTPHHSSVYDAMRALIPDEFQDTTRVTVTGDDPVHGIARAAAEAGASCIVMGEHTRSPLARWFSHDTSDGVLHEAPCPVWYIPRRRAA